MKLIAYLSFLLSAAVLSAQSYQEKIVAAVLTAEAATEGTPGLLAVAEVINQRCQDKGKTPYQVVTARHGGRHAFSCLNRTSPDRLFKRRSQEPNYPLALRVSLLLCREPAKLPHTTQQANHYTRKDEKPYWAKGHRPVAVIGAHAFYRLSSY